ncbi:MAG: hypothetical protein DRR00_19865, partial [Candidatus Parabeggiatoa sp. nov. 3]
KQSGQPQGIAPTTVPVGAIPCGCPKYLFICASVLTQLFNDFYQARYQEPVNELELNRLLENLRLIKNHKLTLAGALQCH